MASYKEGVKALVGASASEGATEYGQEEALIQLRDALTEDDYSSSEEADARRLEAGAARALAGGARGAVLDVPAQALSTPAPNETGTIKQG